MRFGGEDGVFVQLCHDDLITCVRQIFDDSFQFLADAFNLVVGLVAEEHFDNVRRRLQVVCYRICFDVSGQLLEDFCIALIGWILDDDFLAGDMSFDTQAEHLHHHIAPDIYVEYR